jgi:serine/threonine protein kinase
MIDESLIGKTLGGCHILDVIGVGGMATVYRAHQASMDRAVAVKIMPRHLLNDETYMLRFEREVRIAAQLEHRGIVPVHDYGVFEGQPYIVMRFMAGGSVDQLLDDGTIPLDRALRIVEQIAGALDFAHSKGVLHRDLKPSNVLLDDGGDAYLTDFGIARLMGDVSAGITTQGVVGTPSYMSPEQAQGGALDGRSDLYSLGVMVFEMLTGRRPFESETPYGVAIKHVNDPPPMPRAYNPDLPAGVEQAILIALHKQPDARYPDAISFAEALKRGARAIPAPNDTAPALKRDPPPYARPTPLAAPPLAAPNSVYPAPPTPTPITPPPSDFSAIYTPLRPITPVTPKRGGVGGMIVSAGVGVLIGCSLLTVLVIVAVLVIANADQIERTLAVTLAGRNPASEGTLTAQSLSGTVSDMRSGTVSGTESSNRDSLTTPLNTLTRRVTSAPTATIRAAGASIPLGLQTRALPTATPDPNARTMLVYAAENASSFDLYARDIDTGLVARLTDHIADDLAPAVAPDGTRVAFISDRDGDFDIYVADVIVSADTIRLSAARRMTVNSIADRAPTWLPDSLTLIFASDVRGDGTSDLLSIDADGSDLRLVYSDGTRLDDPSVSADAASVVFTRGAPNDATTWEIVRLDLASSDVTRLTQNRVKDASPAFLPDGSIIYTTDGDGYGALAAMDADGGNRRMIYDSPGYDWGARVMADGTLIFASDGAAGTGIDQVYALSLTAGIGAGTARALTTAGGAWGALIIFPS